MGAEPALDTVVWFPVRSNSKFFLSLLPIDGGKLQQEDPTAAIEKRREVVIRGLIEYMGEKPGDLISDLQSLEETEDTRQNIAYPVKIVKQFRGVFVTCPHVKEEKAMCMASTILPTSKQF
uniref:Uncharacterized protein n=1 Tax=Knipowitschia caucasica TaxID=637954 RepID=A0AAV2LKQ4_KNICA